MAIERDVLMYRAYLAQVASTLLFPFTLYLFYMQRKYAVVLNEVTKSSPVEVRAVRLLAEYLNASGAGGR